MVLVSFVQSPEIQITEDWHVVKIVGSRDNLEAVEVGDIVEYVPSWNEYKLSDLDREMYNKGFRYKRILVMKNNEDVELTNELMPVTLDTATPINEGKMRDDCGDLRFYWWNEDTQAWEEISYWIDQDTVNSSSTKVILRIPKVSSSGYVNIVAYYGAKHYGRKDDLTIGFGNRCNGGKILSFDGEDDYIEVVDDTSLDVSNGFTVVVLFESYADYNNDMDLVAKGNGAGAGNSNSQGWWLDFQFSRLRFITVNADYSYQDTGIPVSSIKIGTHFVAGVFEPNVTQKLWLDGQIVSQKTPGDILNSNRKLTIASYDTTQQFLDGKIYTVMIYNRALSDDEIQAIYENPNDPPRAGLVLWLAPDSVDEANGKWLDKSGLGNDGTINGATPVEVRTFEESVQTNKVLSFDGVDDYVDLGDKPEFDITDEISIYAIVQNNDGTFDTGGIVRKYNTEGDQRAYALEYNSGELRFLLSSDGTSVVSVGYSDFDPTVFHDVCAVYDGSYMKLYVNGAKVGETSYSDGIFQNNEPLLIGRDISGQYLNGKICAVMIWNRALSDEEVQQLHNDPNNPPLDGLVLWLDGTSIDEANGKWLNKAPALKSGYVETLDGTINGATPTTLLSSAWSDEIDMNNGLKIVWKGKVVKKITSSNSVVLYVKTANMMDVLGEVV